jgi:beta-mannosidase
VLTIAGADLKPDEMLSYTWETADGTTGSDTFAPKPYKDYDLQAPNLTHLVSGNTLTLTAQTLALFVAVEADVPGRFDHNAFTLLPGQTKVVQFTPTNPAGKPNFTLRDLHSATYA